MAQDCNIDIRNTAGGAAGEKIVCLVDSLGSGGAQRQMTELLRALSERRYEPILVTYHREHDHFLPAVQDLGICPHYIDKKSILGRAGAIRKLIKVLNPACVVSFLTAPNLYALFGTIGWRSIPTIVSERSFDYSGVTFKNRLRYLFYSRAKLIITNSEAQRRFICDNFPRLGYKTRVILNSVDLDAFVPRPRETNQDFVRILVGASVNEIKNTHRFIRAFGRAAKRLPPGAIKCDWIGNNFFSNGKPTPASTFFLESKKIVEQLGLTGAFQFKPPVRSLAGLIPSYDVAVLPSLYEGCPNFVCESMASGVPILASKVGDLEEIITPSCGILFNPLSEDDIANAIVEFTQKSTGERVNMGKACREQAEKLFSRRNFSERFAASLSDVIGDIVQPFSHYS